MFVNSSGVRRYIDPESMDNSNMINAAELLRRGKVIVCPTDTCYIFAADALSMDSVQKVFTLKGREYNNPIHVVVAHLEMAKQYAEFSSEAMRLAEHFFPGPLTIILPKKSSVPDLLTGGRATIGIRVPNSPIALRLAQLAQLPFTATSANKSGRSTPFTVEDVIKQFPDLQDIDMIIDQGPLPSHETSTIIDVAVQPPRILREGPIPGVELLQFLHTGA